MWSAKKLWKDPSKSKIWAERASQEIERWLRLQTEYMVTRRTNIIVHGVPMVISEDRVEAFFAKYDQVEEICAVTSKSGIATGDIALQVTLTRQTQPAAFTLFSFSPPFFLDEWGGEKLDRWVEVAGWGGVGGWGSGSEGGRSLNW